MRAFFSACLRELEQAHFASCCFFPLMKKRRFCIPVTAVCTEIISDFGVRLTKTKNPAYREALRTGTGYAYAWLEYEYGGRKYLCQTQHLSRSALPDIGDTVELLLNKYDFKDFCYSSFAYYLKLTGGLVGAMIFLIFAWFYTMAILMLPV